MRPCTTSYSKVIAIAFQRLNIVSQHHKKNRTGGQQAFLKNCTTERSTIPSVKFKSSRRSKSKLHISALAHYSDPARMPEECLRVAILAVREAGKYTATRNQIHGKASGNFPLFVRSILAKKSTLLYTSTLAGAVIKDAFYKPKKVEHKGALSRCSS